MDDKCKGHHSIISIKKDKFPITLKDFKERIPYKEKGTDERICIVKWGQRKLLLTCLQFLTIAIKKYKKLYDEEKLFVLYVGAGDGTNIFVLSKMFPKLKFELFDDHFDEKILQNQKNIKLFIKYFFDEDAEKYKNKGKYMLFISDIRTTRRKDEPANIDIYNNSLKQFNWINIMKPLLSHLKFRCLFNTEKLILDDETFNLHKKIFEDNLSNNEIEQQTIHELKYNKGKIFFQPWTGPTSSETRLLVKQKKIGQMINYLSSDYENALYAFNHMKHTTHYDATIDNLCDCYDCNLELYIINNYLKLFNFDKQRANNYSIYFNYILRIPYKTFKLKNKNNFDFEALKKLRNFERKGLNKIQFKFIHMFISNKDKYTDKDFDFLFTLDI